MKCPSITEILSMHLQTDSSKAHSELKAWMVVEGHLAELERKSMGFLREHKDSLSTDQEKLAKDGRDNPAAPHNPIQAKYTSA